MTHYRERTGKDWVVTGLLVGAFSAIVVASASLLVESHLRSFLLTTAVLLLLLVYWHTGTTAYRCAECGHEFEIPMLTDLTSPHMLTTKYIRCPVCGKRSWAKVLVKVADRGASSRRSL